MKKRIPIQSKFFFVTVVAAVCIAMFSSIPCKAVSNDIRYIESLIKTGGLHSQGCQFIGKSTVFLTRALKTMSYLDDGLTQRREFERKKRLLLDCLHNTMRIESDRTEKNPILTIHEIISEPFAPPEIDLIYWCLKELIRTGRVKKQVAKDYVDNYMLYDPTNDQKGAIKKLQERLRRNKYNITIDGIFGEKSLKAMNSYQKSTKLHMTYFPNTETVRNLGLSPELFLNRNNYKKIVILLNQFVENQSQ